MELVLVNRCECGRPLDGWGHKQKCAVCEPPAKRQRRLPTPRPSRPPQPPMGAVFHELAAQLFGSPFQGEL